MKTNKEIRANAKARLSVNYWPCVLAALIVSAVLGVLSVVSYLPSMITSLMAQFELYGIGAAAGTASLLIITSSVVTMLISILSMALSGPLSIGLNAFFIQSIHRDLDTSEVSLPFTEAFRGYARKLGGYYWCSLFTFLWSLLFIVPGIIKSLSYSCTPYILADCPNVKAKDALKLSMRIMNGYKGRLFVLSLSYIGWDLLNGLTFGILGIFYVGPYKRNALANFYLEVRETALINGTITPAQLDGYEPV